MDETTLLESNSCPMSSQTETWTILRLLKWTTEFFQSKNFESPRLDAEVLLATALDVPRIQLYARYNDEPGEEARTAYRELVRRRSEGVPVAYLVGHKEFYSLDLRVDPNVLIPRPETEHLVIEAIDTGRALLQQGAAELTIVDCGTGSGAIAIALASHLPKARIIATDQSEAALRIAQYNVDKHKFESRIELRQGDLLAPLAGSPPVDMIVSNPPYVSQQEYDQLDREVREHEPREALLAGERGTELIERLAEQAADQLKSGGRLIVEFSPMIAGQVRSFLEKSGTYDDIRVIKDVARNDRIVSARRKGS